MSARWIFTKVSFLPARRSLRNDHTAQPREKCFPRRIVSAGAHRRVFSFQFPLRYECEIITAPFFVFRRFNVFVANILPFLFSFATDRYKFPWKTKRAGGGGSETRRNINVTCRDWSLEYQVNQVRIYGWIRAVYLQSETRKADKLFSFFGAFFDIVLRSPLLLNGTSELITLLWISFMDRRDGF